MGREYVSGSEGGADIYLDGVYWGKTPGFVQSIPPGMHHILITREGYTTYERDISVKAYGITVLAGIRLSGTSGSVLSTSYHRTPMSTWTRSSWERHP